MERCKNIYKKIYIIQTNKSCYLHKITFTNIIFIKINVNNILTRIDTLLNLIGPLS